MLLPVLFLVWLVADLMNCAPIRRPDAAIASLFLAGFVSGRPWAHLDICATAQNDDERSWHPSRV